MKNKGFTLVEVIVTFSLVSVISLLLLQIILSLRDVYVQGDIQTTLLSKQGIFTKKIYDDLLDLKVKTITSCGDYCITFTYENGATGELEIEPENSLVRYNDYRWKLDNGSSFGTVETSVYTDPSITGINSILKIDIPISNKLIDGDYGIHVIYQYDSTIAAIPTKIDASSMVNTELYNQYGFFR